MKIRAAVCYEFCKPLVIEDVELSPPRKNEVKIRVATTAICHSDIHEARGELPGDPPFVGGHESAGYVEEVGADVTSLKPGDSVVVSLLRSCGRCHYCITGLRHLCINRVLPTFEDTHVHNSKGQPLVTKGCIGGFAEYIVVDESMAVKIPEDLPMDRAALLACGVITGWGAAVNRAKIKPFNSVVVIGTGGVGINAIQGAAFSGAFPLIAVDVLDDRLKSAMNFGATHTVNAKQPDAIEIVKQLTSGRGADFVLVTVGNIAAVEQGFQMLGPRGTTILVGLPSPKEKFSFSVFDFLRGEKTLTACSMGSTNTQVEIPNLIALYRSGHLKLDDLVTGHYPLEKINEAMESSSKGEGLRNVIMFE